MMDIFEDEEDIYDAVSQYRKDHPSKFKISFIFAWYDLWIGLFWDKNKRWLYILPIPCCGIILKFKEY